MTERTGRNKNKGLEKRKERRKEGKRERQCTSIVKWRAHWTGETK